MENISMQPYWRENAQRYRLDMPRAERRHPWLRHAFDCYAVVDASVAEALAASGRKSACAPGCHNCCSQAIPVTPLEVAALRWFIREAMPGDRLSALREKAGKSCPDNDNGKAPHDDAPCRFLLGGSCAVYAVRPVACRRYIIFGEACAPGEDATRTRLRDVLRPSREALHIAYALTLPYYAALGESVPEAEAAFAFMTPRTIKLADVSGMLLTF